MGFIHQLEVEVKLMVKDSAHSSIGRRGRNGQLLVSSHRSKHIEACRACFLPRAASKKSKQGKWRNVAG